MTATTRVILTLDLPPLQDGGIATLVDVLATGLHQIGERVVVYARGRGEGVRRWDRARPYEVVRMRGHSWVRHPTRNLLPYIPHMHARYRPATLIAANWQLAGAPARLARKLGMPVSVLVYGRDVTALDVLPAPVLEADRVVALTDWLAGELIQRGLPTERVAGVHAAVHEPHAVPDSAALRARLAPGPGPVVLALGRLIPRKGQDELIRSWPGVLRAHPGATLLLVGQGPDRPRLEALICEHRVQDHVHLTGFLEPDELDAVYGLADLFALPCREEDGGDTEGFGLVFLEAGVRGLAVVGGRTAGVVEAVLDGETGVLVQPGDGPALSRALVDLLSDDERRQRLARSGRARVLDRYLPRHYARRVLEVTP
jgi:phosphatidyl-myo-inositol dimannoside synthase